MRHLLASFIICIALTNALCAASTADLAGDWVVDTAATWENMQNLPQLAGLGAEQKAAAKEMFVAQLAAVQFTFTATTLTSNMGGQKKSESYKVVAETDAGLTCEGTDEQGVTTRSLVKPKGNTLSITNLADPTQVITLKRK